MRLHLLRCVRCWSRCDRWPGCPPTAPLFTAGQSLGGLFTAMATTRFPDLVAGGVAQSPPLWWPAEGLLGQDRGAWFCERAATPESSPMELQWGAFVRVLEHDVALSAELLRTQGKLVSAQKTIGGHDPVWSRCCCQRGWSGRWERPSPPALEIRLRRGPRRETGSPSANL